MIQWKSFGKLHIGYVSGIAMYRVQCDPHVLCWKVYRHSETASSETSCVTGLPSKLSAQAVALMMERDRRKAVQS
jgi:hypothetical protein